MNTAGGLDPDALVAGQYDTRQFHLTPRAKAVFAGGRKVDVHQDTEARLVLPNGCVVKVTTDASGHTTHIEEDDRLHAVARPNSVRLVMQGSLHE